MSPLQRRRHRRHHWRYGRTLRGALLAAFISAVVVTAAIVSAMFFVSGERGFFTDEVRRVARYAAHNVVKAKDAQAFLDETSRTFATRLVLKEDGAVVAEAGAGVCRRPIVIDIDEASLTLEACRPQPQKAPWKGAAVVAAVVAVLALMSSAVARRIAWPLRSLAETARKIGEGDLSARPHIGPHPFVEVRLVGDALKEMAERIERELKGSRALLAGASHELRTPLGHLRILVETAREQYSPKLLDEIEKEVKDLDTLLEKLLAQARLDFARIDRRDVDVTEVARRALARAAPDSGVVVTGSAPVVQGDATLLARAIGNLVENAEAHGGGVVAVTVSFDEGRGRVVVAVDDDGRGVDEKDRERIFLPFVHQSDRAATARHGGLGLGLHLVSRIAEAHGGSVAVSDRGGAENGGGARFVLSLPA